MSFFFSACVCVFTAVISCREVNESAWAASVVLSRIWPRSHHTVFPEHFATGRGHCVRMANFYVVALITKQTDKQGTKKSMLVFSVGRFAPENFAVTFQCCKVRCGREDGGVAKDHMVHHRAS